MTSSMMFLFVLPVSSPAQGSSVIMVITEVSHVIQFIQVEISAPFIVVISKIIHIFLIEKSVPNPEEKWIIQNTIDMPNVITEVKHISIKDLSNSVYSCSLRKLCPEPLGYLWNSIDSQTINMILLNEISYPIQKSISNIWIFLLEICKSSQSTVFNFPLIVSGKVIVCNFTPIMIMVALFEGIIDTKISIKVSHMISNDINHDPNASFVTGTNEINKILLTSKSIVELIYISAPITMISSISIIDYRRDPDGIKAHSLNIIKIIDDSSISSTTIVAFINIFFT